MKKRIDEDLRGFEESTARVKQSINEAKLTIDSYKKLPFKKILYPSMGIAFLTVILVVLFIDRSYTNEPITSNENENNDSIVHYEERIPDPISIAIYQYEIFYRDPNLYSAKESLIKAIEEVTSFYGNIYLAEDLGVAPKKDRLTYYEERGKRNLHRLLEDEAFVNYYARLKQELGITDEQYIQHYFAFQYELMEVRGSLHSIDENGQINEKNNQSYMEKVLTSLDLRNGLVQQLKDEVNEERMEILKSEVPNPNVSFNYEELSLTIGVNNQDEYIFINAGENYNRALFSYASERNKMLYEELLLVGFGDFNRQNMQEIYETFVDYDSSDPSDVKFAKEVVEIIKIMMNSIEWDYDVSMINDYFNYKN